MIEQLLTLDRSLFLFINQTCAHELLDPLFIFLTAKKYFGVCALLFLLYFLKTNMKLRQVFWGLVISIALSDIIAARVIKKSVKRIRPCVALAAEARLPWKSKSSYSFPSNHATNVFAASAFLWKPFPAQSPILFGIAFLVAYSRIYLGFHYPSDVLAGALLGFIIGFLIFHLMFRKRVE